MAFSITEVPLRAGLAGLSPLPGRQGDYAADLAAVRDWAPALVISLTTEDEMARKGAGGFGGDLQRLGIGWAALPLADFAAPDETLATRWMLIAERASEILDGGGRILVHCMGGCGRSGAAVLRLMVEAGEEPQAALSRLRALRPCAVEKPEQLRWATQGMLP
ncbi:cyclin-dependent kinase inhibitor 3 family protein [Paracoccaceae bacterium]